MKTGIDTIWEDRKRILGMPISMTKYYLSEDRLFVQTGLISMKIEVEEEIRTVLTGKQMEEKVMSMVPFFIIFYIDLTSPGFFSVMYGNITGIVIMSACLLVYGIAVWLGERIMNISMSG